MAVIPPPKGTTLELPEVITVKQLADVLNQPVTAVITKLMGYGVLATINEDIDFDTASIVADEFGVVVTKKPTPTAKATVTGSKEGFITRPPVVTIMGHVDHGKTTLLDTIRKTNVAAKEVGGITQHISSYQIEVTQKGSSEKRLITFLDTPGHSAFEAMRRHGAQITDLVVLVVAADDGVKPQTIEAINHARVMNVPIVVAINKIDKPDADPERVKRELSEYNLLPEEWGGNTVVVPISAKEGTGIPELLEMVTLITDMKDLKANPNAPAVGVVIESHMEMGIGPVATVLIQNGTLHLGDYIAVGGVSGKVRTMTDYRGKRVEFATPATPVEISGLSAVPNFGEQIIGCENEHEARDTANQFLRSATAKRATASHANGTGLVSQKEGSRTILNVVIKADTNGSLEAIRNGLLTLRNEDVEVRIVSEGVGDISENDVTMASTSKGSVIGFQVRLPASVKSLADREKVPVSLHSIIYELFETIREALAALMPMIEVEKVLGSMKVLARFRDNRKHPVLGGLVQEGIMQNGAKIRIERNGHPIAHGVIIALRHGKDEMKQIKSGSECGMEITLSSQEEEPAEKDIVVCYTVEEQRKALNL
jgi:translation initiation factor IF-2